MMLRVTSSVSGTEFMDIGLQCCDTVYGGKSKKVDTRETWYWITRVLASLLVSSQQLWDPIASSSTNHELCRPLLNGLKAGVPSDSILECEITQEIPSRGEQLKVIESRSLKLRKMSTVQAM
jgi:hypothetical protein